MIRLIFLIALFLIQQDCKSQNVVDNPARKYNPAMQRLLIKIVGTYLYSGCQKTIQIYTAKGLAEICVIE